VPIDEEGPPPSRFPDGTCEWRIDTASVSCRARSAPERSQLPLDPGGLPALGPRFDTILDEGLAALALSLGPGARAAIDAQARLLIAWNTAINLTALRTPEAIARLHVLDSLSALPLLRDAANARGPAGVALLDLGSGAGYPGLPLAVALPCPRAALVDSIGKKVRFLHAVGAAAAAAMRAAGETPPHVEAIAARAEELARQEAHRETWDVVTARAVGSLAEVVELALPFLRLGGRLICWKRDDGRGTLQAELDAARPIAGALGGGVPHTIRVAAPDPSTHRLVQVFKQRRTPPRFPRTPAERRRALLG
jgi:16S rRNA (guanine527-N7)-methyltransferase